MPWWRYEPFLFLYGFGIGLATAQLTSVILADVPPAQSGEASGIQSTSRQVGSALGVAILGSTLALLFTHDLAGRLERLPLAAGPGGPEPSHRASRRL